MKKVFLVSLLILTCSSFLFAGGEKDVNEREIGNRNSWQETFDITDKPTGKYNIVVTATDKAGNESVAGPFNILIDQESDLPIAGITNPSAGMRVPGNLNIVGTCVDDDAVETVNLILDDNDMDIRTADGKEFWSYYLDTNDLEEGTHTIEVFGTDINGLRGHSTKVVWQLDRRVPSIEVTNITMGSLVSGKIALHGTVEDGNGISKLEYSLDGGQYYSQLPIKKVELKEPDEKGRTLYWTFELPVDTKKFDDGPTVCWFRATDGSGSEGIYSFLYFIDNTPPDVKIVYPGEDEAANGIFTIAGFAKDKIGIQKLSWKFGDEEGDFELTAGNPYWVKEVNTIGIAKSAEFVVTATDIAGNVVTLKKKLILNQEEDKPVVTVIYPEEGGNIEGEDGSVYIRGIASDDDEVASVTYKIDAQEEVTVPCKGVFYADVAGELANGAHTLKIYATDKNGVAGNTTTVKFNSKGAAPVFENETVGVKGAPGKFVNGMALNSDADELYQIDIVSSAGISSVNYDVEWSEDSAETKEITLKGGEKKVVFSIPVNTLPWGVSKLTIRAQDIYGRTSKHNAILYLKNLSRIYTDEPGIFLNDSTIAEDGGIKNDPEYPVTGFFAGGNIESAEFVPPTEAAEISIDGNLITLEPGTGGSGPVVIRVTTDKGVTVDSREIYFIEEQLPPSLLLYDESEETRTPLEASDSVIEMEGETDPGSTVTWKILSASVTYSEEGVIAGAQVDPVSEEIYSVDVGEDGHFKFEIAPEKIVQGITVVEVSSANPTGQYTVKPVIIRKINEAPAETAVPAPSVQWLRGENIYVLALYQGQLDSVFDVFKLEDLHAGTNDLTFEVTGPSIEKPVVSKHQEKKKGEISARIDNINGKRYQSGMEINIERGVEKEASHNALIAIHSTLPLGPIEWTLTGPETPGGKSTETGKIDGKKLQPVDETGQEYEFNIPLTNVPARLTDISASITNSEGDQIQVKGTVSIVRSADTGRLDDNTDIYFGSTDNAVFDISHQRYVLNNGAPLQAYANVQAPLTAVLETENDLLEVTVEDHLIKITAKEDGVYEDIVLVVTDALGAEYTSVPVNMIVDAGNPEIELTSPVAMDWIQNTLVIEGTVSDGNGIEKAEFSTDAQKTWNMILFEEDGTFKFEVDLSAAQDGMIPVDLRAVDFAGKQTLITTAIQKDATPPEVRVIIPESGSAVNGENTIAFIVKDNGIFSDIKFISGSETDSSDEDDDYYDDDDEEDEDYDEDESEEEEDEPEENDDDKITGEVPLSSMPHTNVGTSYMPISSDMKFVFTDHTGNETVINTWDFTIDPQSDLPVAEIHLPVENEVVTRDFNVTGVIYDDDGNSRVYYKIDDNEYQLLSDYCASYTKMIPITELTDNEHTISVYAEDIHGIIGPEVVRTIRVSLEEPKGGVEIPEISETVNGVVTLQGIATDENGIEKVQISVDNGATFNDAIGEEEWEYTFNTKTIQDGTHVVFVKIYDGYGITGLYSSLINVDNTSPNLSLDLPLDDSTTSHNLFFSGQTTDNIALTELFITIRSLEEGKTVPVDLSHIELTPAEIISEVIDLGELDDGFYNIELTGTDAAGNITRVSRNIQLDKTTPLTEVGLLYPLNGEHVCGEFSIYGNAVSEDDPISNVMLFIDGKLAHGVEPQTVTETGYYKFTVRPNFDEFEIDTMTDGEHSYKVIGTTESGQQVESAEQYLVYSKTGPWITLDNFTYGDFAINRPLLKGDAGYLLTQEESDALKAKDTPKEKKAVLAQKSVKQVFLSLDNGKTYVPVSGKNKGKWEYRIENEDITAGYHFLLIKAEMNNGENAITRLLIQVDHKAPEIRLISPGEGGHYNQTLSFAGLTNDDVALKNVTLSLRSGDRAAYEVPGFIQGLYFDVSVWGATLYNLGVGLTAFDNAVKIQANFGQFTQEQRDAISDIFGMEPTNLRFGGNVLSAKIIAQLAYLPFRYFFGRDWDWLSASAAVGANFSWFSKSGAYDSDGNQVPQMLSAAFVQLEFPKVNFNTMKYFKSWAFYVEPQVWFIPSDVVSADAKKFVFTMTFGIRTSVF